MSKTNAVNAVVESGNTTALEKRQKNITDIVQARIHDMMGKAQLFMPADYSPENALKAAWIELQTTKDKDDNLALTVCDKESVANCLLDMVVQGLSPAKKQCYFIPFGKKLTLMRSYFGTVAVARRFSDVKDVIANCIFEGDTFEFEIDPMTGLKKIVKHQTSFENIDTAKIKGAYAVVLRESAEPYVEIMNMDQIKKAWGQGAAKGNSPAHKNFAEEMSKKTVINRACKMFINSANDEPVLVEAFNRTSESDMSRERPKNYYDADADVIIDVEEQQTTQQAAAAVFGGNNEPQNNPENANALTDEEKAEIEALEAAEATGELEKGGEQIGFNQG